jgi:hypothetical protein
MISELKAVYDSRISFYGKAKIKEIQYIGLKLIELYSYDKLVAKIEEKENKKTYIYLGNFSQTTTRHQREFFKQNGLNDADIMVLMANGTERALTLDFII